MESTEVRKSKKNYVREVGILLSLCGVLACNYFGFGLGRVIFNGLLVSALGPPLHRQGVNCSS